jgi:hypothetical protein
MLVICFAGFVVNMTSGLAWGLLLAWARDGLGMDGAQRNLASACYESLKVRRVSERLHIHSRSFIA